MVKGEVLKKDKIYRWNSAGKGNNYFYLITSDSELSSGNLVCGIHEVDGFGKLKTSANSRYYYNKNTLITEWNDLTPEEEKRMGIKPEKGEFLFNL